MKKYAITAFALTFLVFRTYGGERECLNFIYCSDLHYGLEREFRGGEVSADSVSRAMIGAFRLCSRHNLGRNVYYLTINT